MVTTESIKCDNCKSDIAQEYSSYPNNVRYWSCIPRYSKPNSMMYAVYREPAEPKDYCIKCFTRMIANLERDNG